MTFPFRPVPFRLNGNKHPFSATINGNGTGDGSRRQKVRKTGRTVASLNKMPKESKKAERGTISVNLLHLELIGVDY